MVEYPQNRDGFNVFILESVFGEGRQAVICRGQVS